jgi:hypothetical protein
MERCYNTFSNVLFATIRVTSVKILRQFADSGVNYTEKLFNLTPVTSEYQHIPTITK